MFVTIWMCTQEWSLISMRATALTFATCHQPFSWSSLFTRSITVRSFLFARTGTRMRICATASAGVRRVSRSASAEAGWSMRSSVSSSIWFESSDMCETICLRCCDEPARAVAAVTSPRRLLAALRCVADRRDPPRHRQRDPALRRSAAASARCSGSSSPPCTSRGSTAPRARRPERCARDHASSTSTGAGRSAISARSCAGSSRTSRGS